MKSGNFYVRNCGVDKGLRLSRKERDEIFLP